MLQSPCVKALCLLLILQPKEGNTGDLDNLLNVLLSPTWTLQTDTATDEKEKRGVLGTLDLSKATKPPETHQHPWLGRFEQSSSSSLKELTTRVTEILDRISRNWALEGAKTIQNGEIRLRKLNKELNEKVTGNGSKYGRHVERCMNSTNFRFELDLIMDETTDCYSRSFAALEVQLSKIEDAEKAILQKMKDYGKDMFDKLSDCFLKNSTPRVIECLQKVDAINIGSHIRDEEATKLIVEMGSIINGIPQDFSDCTARGIVETIAHVRKGYAMALTCLNEHLT